jgi:hypothetical protein
MKFTTTENTSYKIGIGQVPKSWIESDTDDHIKTIRSYYMKHIHHWDYDCGEDEEHDFLFDDGTAYRLYYSYWSEWHHEDEEENGLKDSYHIEEIKAENAKVPCKKQRDWL